MDFSETSVFNGSLELQSHGVGNASVHMTSSLQDEAPSSSVCVWKSTHKLFLRCSSHCWQKALLNGVTSRCLPLPLFHDWYRWGWFQCGPLVTNKLISPEVRYLSLMFPKSSGHMLCEAFSWTLEYTLKHFSSIFFHFFHFFSWGSFFNSPPWKMLTVEGS